MVDVVAPNVRSRMMSGIRATDTKPERLLRKGLHARGLRFRLHDKRLPGRPDLVLPKWRAALFAHGCFWHGHSCPLFKWPKSRPMFWREKIEGNRTRDAAAVAALRQRGWRVGVVWECALKGPGRLPLAYVLEKCEDWLRSDAAELEIEGIALRSPL
jgi:DNA mismatch endonuclease (patch repair protein)